MDISPVADRVSELVNGYDAAFQECCKIASPVERAESFQETFREMIKEFRQLRNVLISLS